MDGKGKFFVAWGERKFELHGWKADIVGAIVLLTPVILGFAIGRLLP